MCPRRKVKKVNRKYYMRTIRGVPVDRCIDFVWSIVRKMGAYSKYHYMVDSNDLFQAGFVEFIKSSKKFDKTREVHLFTYLYQTVRGNAIIREVQKNHLIRFPSYFWDIYYKLFKKYREDKVYFNYSTQTLNFQKLYEDGIINNLSKAGLELCEKLVRNDAILELDVLNTTASYANLTTICCSGADPSGSLTKAKSNPRYENCINEVGDEFTRIITDLQGVSDISKQIFIKSYGIGCAEVTPKELSEEYGIDRNSVYRIRRGVKEALLEEGSWVRDNFGEKMLKKLRLKEAVS